MNSQSTALKGKRKKAVPKTANPLFTKWLTEWKEEAVEKGWKSQYNYAKALKTLKVFPLCLESGKDCKMLQNFGDKICKMLDEKLAEYKQSQNNHAVTEKDGQECLIELPGTRTSGSECASHQVCTSKSNRTSYSATHAISDSSDSGKDETQKKKKRKSSGTRSREYVPVYRSGPYALLLALYKYSQDPDYKGFLTKAELIHAAQPLVDKSFSIPDVGSHYTAWSSMGTLIKKELVSKYGCPARYALTDNGQNLGERLQNAENGGNDVTHRGSRLSGHCHPTPSSVSPLRMSSNSDSSDRHNKSNYAEKEASNFVPSRLIPDATDDPVFIVSDDDDVNKGVTALQTFPSRFCAQSLSSSSSAVSLSPPHVGNSIDNAMEVFEDVNDDAICVVEDKGKADSDSDEVNITSASFPASPKHHRLPSLSPASTSFSSSKDFHISQFSSQSKQDCPANSHKFDNDVIEIDDDNDDIINVRTSPKNDIFHRVNRYISSEFNQSDEEELPDLDLDIPLSKRLLSKGGVNSQLLLATSDNSSTQKSDSEAVSCNYLQKQSAICSKHLLSHNALTVVEKQTSKPITTFTSVKGKDKDNNQSQRTSDNSNVIKTNSPVKCVTRFEELKDSSEMMFVPQFTLLPGAYEIVLCIDNREFYGSKSNSKTLLPDLMQSGTSCDLRLLHIGDILWIARELGSENDGISKSDRKELVLNFAIERKRMDDLVSSITGGRLKEQKFRLRNCGLSELIILIEEYGSIQNFSISEDRIKQSIVNSQILDGFKVKRCGSSKEAVMYLAMMTRFIQKYYGNKTLHAASHEYVKARSTRASARDAEFYLMPFNIFNETSIKHKALTVKEMFGKHLLQIPGVSLDRASAITNVYPTLRLLLKAYEECISEKSRESLLATIKCGNKDRNLGIAVSRIINMMYNTKGALS